MYIAVSFNRSKIVLTSCTTACHPRKLSLSQLPRIKVDTEGADEFVSYQGLVTFVDEMSTCNIISTMINERMESKPSADSNETQSRREKMADFDLSEGTRIYLKDGSYWQISAIHYGPEDEVPFIKIRPYSSEGEKRLTEFVSEEELLEDQDSIDYIEHAKLTQDEKDEMKPRLINALKQIDGTLASMRAEVEGLVDDEKKAEILEESINELSNKRVDIIWEAKGKGNKRPRPEVW
jgi:hypothetical protein